MLHCDLLTIPTIKRGISFRPMYFKLHCQNILLHAVSKQKYSNKNIQTNNRK